MRSRRAKEACLPHQGKKNEPHQIFYLETCATGNRMGRAAHALAGQAQHKTRLGQLQVIASGCTPASRTASQVTVLWHRQRDFRTKPIPAFPKFEDFCENPKCPGLCEANIPDPCLEMGHPEEQEGNEWRRALVSSQNTVHRELGR